MDSRHAIDQAVFDISFDSADTAVEQQHELAGFIRDRLLPLAEEIFGELSERGSVSKIDLLEIDLGDIGYDGYREEMTGRFRERLRAILQDKLREIAAAPSAHEYIVDRTNAEGELLQHFLETGNLARGTRGGAEEFERMLLRSLSSSGSDFAAYLRRTSSRATVVGRLARQFPRSALSAVLRLLAPEQAARLGQLADERLQAQLRERPQAAAAELMSGIWEALLHELLQGGGSGTEAEQCFAAAMRRQHPDRDATEAPAAAKLLAARLAAALYGGSTDECAQLWNGVLSTSPETLRAVFAERLGEMRARQRLAAVLSHERLLELAACIAPQHGEAIAALFEHPAMQAMLEGVGKVSLWERVLGALHAGTAFDRERFGRELQAVLLQPDDENFTAQIHATLAAGDVQVLRVILKQTLRNDDGWLDWIRRSDAPTRRRFAELLQHDELLELAACIASQHGEAMAALFQRPAMQAMLAGDGKVSLWEHVLDALHSGTAFEREQFERELQAVLLPPDDENFTAQIDTALAAGDAQALHLILKKTHRDGEGWANWIRRSNALTRRRFAELLGHDELLELAAHVAPQRSKAIAALFQRPSMPDMLAGTDKVLLWERVLDALHSGKAFELGQIEWEWTEAVQQQAQAEAGNVSSQQSGQQPGRLAEIERRLRGAVGAKRIDEEPGEPGNDELRGYADLLRRLRSGEFSSGLDDLEADELAWLVRTAARSEGAQPGGDFERGIARQAHLAADARRYYREVLRQLLDGETVDLERAAQAAAAPMSADALLQARLEAAMVQGRADALQESWAMLLREHPALVRATFMRHMGDERRRRKLVSGFPQAMLRQLLQLLAPQQGGHALALLDQVLRGAVADSEAAAALQAACWDYTFEYLHAAEEGALEIDDYARGLVRRLSASDAAPPVDEAAAGVAHRLLQRLQGRAPQDDASGDIGELSGTDSAGFGALLRRLRDGEIRPGLSALGSGELRQFAVAIVRLNGGAAGTGFIGEIEKHARQARDVRRYYLHVAECLLHERIVDLEQALAQAGAQQQGVVPDREPQGSLRHWLGQLLARTVAGTAGIAPERAGYVRVAFMRIMADAGARRELLSGRHEARMPELVAELQPAAVSVVALLRGSAAGRPAAGFWARTLEYLHAVGSEGFDVRAYLGRMLAFDGEHAHGDGTVAVGRLAPDEVHALLDACAEEGVRDEAGDAEPDPHARLSRLLRGSRRRDGPHAAASAAAAAREATLHARFASALDTGAAQETGRWWDELRTRHADMARAVLLERTADAQVCANIAAGFPESMLAGLLDLAAPGMGKLAGTLADRLRLQGHSTEVIATLWHQSLASLETEARGFSARRYGRGLAERLAAMGVEPGDVLTVTEAGPSSATPERDHRQTGRAARLLHIVGQRLAGHLGEEVTEQIEELAASHCDVTRELLRQLRAGELDCNVAQLTVRESERLVALFAELEADGARVVQQQRARLEPRALLERLICGRRSGESLPQPRFEAALAARDAPALQSLWRQNRKHAAELGGFFREALADAQSRDWLADWLPQDMLLDLAVLLQPRESRFIAALSTLPGLVAAQQADAARAAWNELTLEFLGTAGVASGLASGQAFGRAAYARAMVHRLAALGLEEEVLWREIVRADEVPGAARPQTGLEEVGAPQQKVQMPQIETMEPNAPELDTAEAGITEWGAAERQPAAVRAADEVRFEREPQAGASDGMTDSAAVQDVPLRAGAGTKPHDEVVHRLRGVAGAAPIDAVLDELEVREPRAYAELLARLQAGEFTAAFAELEAAELERLVGAVARHNGAPPGGDFERSIERHAQLAADLAGYYREVLRQLLDGDAVDLELAANGSQRPPVHAMTNEQAMTGGQDISEVPAMSEGQAMSREQAAGAQPTAFEFGDGTRPRQVEKELYIANAGLVLAAPYLPHLFGRLGLTTASGFSDAAAAERAVHLTQFVVNESCDSPEFLLPLNRMLCGVPESQPIVREIRVSDEERKTVEEMLQAIIAAWKVIGNTSVAGLRESFLQRAGRLSLMEDGWHLEVEKHTLDVLLDQLPWSFAVVKYSWMQQPLYVEWR